MSTRTVSPIHAVPTATAMLQNEAGEIMHLKARREGLMLSLGGGPCHRCGAHRVHRRVVATP